MKYIRILLPILFSICIQNILHAQQFEPRNCDSVLKLISIYSGKATIMLPGCFSLAGKDVIERKYPGATKPGQVYGVKELAYIVSVAFTIKDLPTKQEDLPKIKEIYSKNIVSQGFKLLKSSIEKLNGKDYVVFEYIAVREGHDDMYNILYLSDLDGKLMMASFNCNDLLRDKWEMTGRDILESLKLK